MSASDLMNQPMTGAAIKTIFADSTATFVEEPGKRVQVEGEWLFDSTQIVDGYLYSHFTQDDVSLRITGAVDWNNPIVAGDVDGNGHTTAGDALLIINGLNLRNVIDENSVLIHPSTLSVGEFHFYDVNADGRLTAGDALAVINILNRAPATLSNGEGEVPAQLNRARVLDDSTFAETVVLPPVFNRSQMLVQEMNERPSSDSANASKAGLKVVVDTEEEKSCVLDVDAILTDTWDWLT